MFIIFHITVPILVFIVFSNIFNFRYNKLYLIIGSLIADFDKFLSILGISSGRGFCHTLLFSFIFITIVYGISKRNFNKYFPFTIGIIIHLLLDFTLPTLKFGDLSILFEYPLFYPFCNCDMFTTISIEYLFGVLIGNSFALRLEILGSLLLLFIYCCYLYKNYKGIFINNLIMERFKK